MRLLLPSSALLAVTLCLVAPSARAQAVRLVASDARGVTFQVRTDGWKLSPADAFGRVRVNGLDNAHALAEPGRPILPAFSAMLGIPADAHPSARIVSSTAEVARDNVKLAIGGKPVFENHGPGFEHTPALAVVPAILDGAWPTSALRVGTPSSMRGRRMVSVEVRPFRYDPAAGRLWSTGAITVRVDWNRPSGASASPAGSAAEDRNFDPVFASILLNFDQARPWRQAPAGVGGRAGGSLFARPGAGGLHAAAFDEDNIEVRVQLDTTGLYLLPFESLAANGYPAGIATSQVSVHRHEFLDGADTPYETIELPIEVEDANANGVFDAGDHIWVYARNWAERSQASIYQRTWGDAEVIYVTSKATGGLRMPQRAGWRNTTGLSPLPSYPYFQHFEQNYAAQMNLIRLPSDTTVDLYHWNEIQTYYQRPDTLRVEVRDIDTSRTVAMNVDWVGRTSTPHVMWAAIRNGRAQVSSVVDSVNWSDIYPVTAPGVLRGSAFSEGATNFFREWGKTYSSPPDPANNATCVAGLDWFELTYYRRFKAVRDRMPFNTGDGSGEVQMHLTSFQSDSVRLYDVTDPDNPVRLTVAPAQRALAGDNTLSIDLQDSVAAGTPHKYVAGAVQAPLDPSLAPMIPAPDHFGVVVRRSLYTNTSGDYLLLVPQAWLPAVQNLITLRTNQGLHVIVSPIEDVYDEFNGGRHSGAAVQRYVRYAYNKWNSRFVLLAGDGTLDPLDHDVTSGTDWIPVLPVPGPVPIAEGYEIVPSDNEYACMDGNCDPIFGGNAFKPALFVGRLPVNSQAELQGVVDKLVAYEDLSGDTSWRRHILLSADDAFSGESFFGGGGPSASQYCEKDYEELFVTLSQVLYDQIKNGAGLAETAVDTFWLRQYVTNEPIVPVTVLGDTCRPDRDATRARIHAGVTPILLSKLNNGVMWWNYQGHANEYVLTHEDLYVNSPGVDDKDMFTNDGKPFLFSAFACHANIFARAAAQFNGFGPSLGEDMVNLPRRGAIGSWASVCYEVVPPDGVYHLNTEMADRMFIEPPRDEYLGDRGARVVLGEALTACLAQFVENEQSNQYQRGVAETYTLLGDPATRLSIGLPQDVVVANGTPVADQAPVRLHAVGDTLQLEANMVSTVRLDSLGLYDQSAAGTVAVPASSYALAPAFPDTGASAVTGGRRFQLSFRAPLRAANYTYHLRSTDRYGLQRDFSVVFQLDASLRAEGQALHDGDNVSPIANLSILLLSPKPINPTTDVQLTINGVAQPFQATPNPGDASGREWILSWTHASYPKDDYTAAVTVLGGTPILRTFKVTTASGEIKLSNLYAFPNPFDSDGTQWSFDLLGSDPADVRVSVYTISGHVIYSTTVRGLNPGYHQLPWNGHDAEGSEIANGVYFYRLSAATAAGARTEQLGRMIKLRKPRHVAETVSP